MTTTTAPPAKPPFREALVRRTMITALIMVLILVPSIGMFALTKQPSGTYAAMGALIGIFATISGGTRMGVITAIVVALLAPMAIVSGLSPVTAAALMALMTLTVGRLSIFGLHRATMLVPIFLAWLILSPVPWIPSGGIDRINELVSKSGLSLNQAIDSLQSGGGGSASSSVSTKVTNALIEQRFDSTYLAWIAAFFFVGAILPVIVLHFAARKIEFPKPVRHSRSEAVPYTIAITLLTAGATYYFIDHPKQIGGAFMIATILVLLQLGNDIAWKLTIERVLGTFAGLAVLIGLMALIGHAAYTEVWGIPFPLSYYAIGLAFGAASIMSKFSPRLWIYYVLITPTAALLNAYTTSQASDFGKQRAVDNAVGAVLVLIAAGFTLVASRVMDKHVPADSSVDESIPSPA